MERVRILDEAAEVRARERELAGDDELGEAIEVHMPPLEIFHGVVEADVPSPAMGAAKGDSAGLEVGVLAGWR